MEHKAISLLLAATAVLPALSAAPARRLNRYEYNCTMRDLLGVDFHAGDDFPADNFSYGFDNNAATLTVTPSLLAKYLDAAKKIARAAVEIVPPPAEAELQRRSNASASSDITWKRNFIWEGDYDVQIALAGRNDPFTLSISLDGGEPQRLAMSFDFEGRRYADVRLHIGAGTHELRVLAIRNVDRAIDEEWSKEVARAQKTGTEPLSKNEIRTRLLANKLQDFSGAVKPPYPEYVEARGPYGLVLPSIPAGYAKVFSCGHAPNHHTRVCVRGNLENLARRAWRRPVSPAEMDKIMALVSSVQRSPSTSEQQNLQDQMEAGIEALLVSPAFLFRLENSGPASNNDFALASRLSYFLWSSMPDDELFRAADRKQLDNRLLLAAQARRMLADPKSHALAENFAAQWLEFRNLEFIHRDPARFPQFNNDLRDAMRKETELFFEHVLRQNRSVLDFLDAKYTFVNEALANLYGIPGIVGDRFRDVDLAGTPRVGILTQASVLTVTSYSTRTSPVLRGKWILENILNDPPPPPPANVAALRDPSSEPALTLRQQLEQHRKDAACAGCHSRMDALGFGLENFDAIGEWRSRDGALPVDSSGTLPDGPSFSSPVELARILTKHSDAFVECLTEKLLTFALGRELTAGDRLAAAEISQAAAKNNYRFTDLIIGIVESHAFQADGSGA
jgi:uncharacterized protein DUF1592/uncharacterized protein DUF1588/uncharacterized protein DUF1587/uncharacterized protein DUF1585/uncharacterized protein DUF1595